MKIFRKSIIIFAGLFLISVFLYGRYILSPFPSDDYTSGKIPSQYAVDIMDNRFEKQGRNQCSAFSTAFVLRNFGEKANGTEVYQHLSHKIPVSGYVLPKGVFDYLKQSGLKVQILRGNLKDLKVRLSQGNPVIVLVGKGFRWQHYMTLVGYNTNKKELYFFDSGKGSDTNGSLPGNRTMNENYFLSMWNNGLPIFNRIYFFIQK